jgi:hypothetical protein
VRASCNGEQTVTLARARAILATNPSATWSAVNPNSGEEDVLKRVNEELQESNTPPVTLEVLRWRMKDCLRNLRNHVRKFALSSTSMQVA